MHASHGHTLWGAAVLALSVACLAVWRPTPPERRDSGDPCLPGRGRPTALSASTVSSSDAFALPTSLALAGEYLVVLDAASDSVLHVVDRRDGTLVRSMGRRGKGPGEFDGAWSLAPAGGTVPAVWVWDLRLRRLTLVPVVAEPRTDPEHARMLRIDDGAVLTEPLWLGPDTIVTPGLMLDVRLALYSPQGHRIGGIGHRIGPSAGRPPQAAQADLARRPGRPWFVVAHRYVSRIELLAPHQGQSAVVEGPVRINEDGPTVDLDRFAYVDVAATEDRIVALFSGRRREDFGSNAVFGRCLQVFDWRGNLESAYRLDADLIAITMGPDGSTLYGLRHEPVPAVIRYDLPPAGSMTAAARMVTAGRQH